MNNPKLTNILLGALIICNLLFFIGWHVSKHHHHYRQHIAYGFRGREHGSFGTFHRGFEAYRGDDGGFHGSFRNHNWHRNCGCHNM